MSPLSARLGLVTLFMCGVAGSLFGPGLRAAVINHADVVFDARQRVPHATQVADGKGGWVPGTKSSAIALDNGLVRVLLSPRWGSVLSLQYRTEAPTGAGGVELVAQQESALTDSVGELAGITWRDAAPSARPCDSFTTVAATREMVDVAFRWKYDPAKDARALDVAVHYVVRRGVPGVYTYVVLLRPAAYPASRIGRLELVWPLAHDGKEFTCEQQFLAPKRPGDGVRLKGDPQREGLAPSFAELQAGRREADPARIEFSSGRLAGRAHVPALNYLRLHELPGLVWGRASDVNQVGQWIVHASPEYFAGGPDYAQLVAAHGTLRTAMHGKSTHRPPELTAGKAWSKVYGPFLLYANSAPTAEKAWEEAQGRSALERATWPYSWLTSEPAYATGANRGGVRGRVRFSDAARRPETSTGGWIGMVSVQAEDDSDQAGWQEQGLGRQFWTQLDNVGSFSLPQMPATGPDGRPERYLCYFFAPGTGPAGGVLGETVWGPFEVQAGINTPLPEMNWRVPHQGAAFVFEIGVPDRSAREFELAAALARPDAAAAAAHALDALKARGGFVAPKAGEPGADFPCLHPAGNEADGATPLTIRFDLASLRTGDYWLSIAYVGANSAQAVYVNDAAEPLAILVPEHAHGEDEELMTTAWGGRAAVARFAIPSRLLRRGANTLTLAHGPSPQKGKAVFLYDYIALESPGVFANGIYEVSQNGLLLGVDAEGRARLYKGGAGQASLRWFFQNLGTAKSGSSSREMVRLYNFASQKSLCGNPDGGVTVAVDDGKSNQVWQIIDRGGRAALRSHAVSYNSLDAGPAPAANTLLNLKNTTYGPGQLWEFSPVR